MTRFTSVLCVFSALTIFLLTAGNAWADDAMRSPMDQISLDDPKHVFLFVGDGLASSQRQLAQYFLKELSGDQTAELRMNTFPVGGLNTTHSLDSLVTDSAASATSLATGAKTNSRVIGQTPDGKELRTILEAARDKGFATGVVSNMRLTHATPASFLAHDESRYNENEIAADFLKTNATYLAGGGFRHFVPKDGTLKSKRKDDRDLVSELKANGYLTFVADTKGFRQFTPKGKVKVFAPLAYSEMDYEIDRNPDKEPSLAEMTQKGIEVLSQYEKGFFMMVEGGRIDYAGHSNDPVATVHDVLAFDQAIEKAYEFYRKNPQNTLIVVVGDHETGGLGLGFKNDYFMKVNTLLPIKRSADSLRYNGDRAAFLAMLESEYGLAGLTADEKARINKGLDMSEAKTRPAHMSSYMKPENAAVSAVVSERANLFWTTYAHTGTTVPLTAIGAGALWFGGHKDNTDVAKALAHLLKVTLN